MTESWSHSMIWPHSLCQQYCVKSYGWEHLTIPFFGAIMQHLRALQSAEAPAAWKGSALLRRDISVQTNTAPSWWSQSSSKLREENPLNFIHWGPEICHHVFKKSLPCWNQWEKEYPERSASASSEQHRGVWGAQLLHFLWQHLPPISC